MRSSSIGLKPLIALQLAVVMAVLTALVGYAAYRLARYQLIQQEARFAKEVLNHFTDDVISSCPQLVAEKSCPGFAALANKYKKSHSSMLFVSLFDPDYKLIMSSDPGQTADAMWGAFAGGFDPGTSFDKFLISEKEKSRTLLVVKWFPDKKLMVSGSFSLAGPDKVWTGLYNNLLLYAVFLFAVMFIIGFMQMLRLVVKPLERILASSDRISEGDLEFLLRSDKGSEFGRLGFALSRMARRIEEGKQSLRDQIKQEKRLNRELGQAQQSLIRSEKLASVGKLAAGIAHEVGNPISAVLGYVGMLRTEEISHQEQQDILRRVEQEVERVDIVIRDLLAYSRPGRGAQEATEVEHLVEDAMVLIRPQKKYKQLEVQVQLPKNLPRVFADPDLIRQVLVNLVINALDATDPGGHVWIRAFELERKSSGELVWPGFEHEPDVFSMTEIHKIQLPQEGKSISAGKKVVVFAVIDDGQGIKDEDIIKMFDPFYNTKEPGSGTGLGLAICHAAITASQGEIWAFSRPEQGTQIAFYLPVA